MKKMTPVFLATALAMALTACNQNTPQNTAQDTAQSTPAESTPAKAETAESTTPATGEVTLKTATGEATLSTNPQPLAVYDMTAMQNLAALGVAVQGMPKNLPLDNLKATDTPEPKEIGTLFEPDLEALHALAPKAVFVGSRMAEKSEEIAKVAPVYNLTIDTNNVHEATKTQLTDFGKLFGKETEAKDAIAKIDEAIATARVATEGKGNGLAILVNGTKLSAYGLNSRYGFLHSSFGIPMADETIQEARHGQPISFEYLQKTNPDWLFVLDRGAAIGEEGQSAKQVLDNPLMHGTTAWQKNQIVYLSPESYLAFGGYYQWLTDAKIVTDAFNAKSN